MFQEPQPQSPQQPVQDPTALFDVVPQEIPYSGSGFKAASDMLLNEQAIEQASFNAALRSFQETGKNSPELVAFRRSQRLAGLPEPNDAQEMQRYTEMQRVNLASMQKNSPVLFERLKDYENAELLRRDTAAWSMSERISGSTKRGVVEDEYGKLSFKRNYFKLSEDDEKRYQELKKELQILPSPNGNWLAAAGKMLGQMYGMGAENAGWAILGAGVGALAGPGGAGAGFYWGLTAGTAKQTFMTEAGTVVQDMIDQGYDPEAAKTTGLFHGALSSAMSAVGFGATTASLRSAVRGVFTPTLLSKLGIDPAKKMLFGNFTTGAAFKRYAGGVLAEDMEEIGQELSAIMAERIAASISRDEYQSAIQTAQGTQDISERIMAVAVETFQGMALLGLPGLAADVSANNSRLAQAESRAKALTETINIVRGTDAAIHAPDAFADQIAEIAERQGAEEVILSRKQFDEAVAETENRMRQQNPGINPGDGLLAIRNRFPDLAKQLDDAEKSGADLRLKVADVALMARGEFGLHTEILKRGRIVGEGMDGDTGISWEEAAKQRMVVEQLRTQAVSIEARRGKKHQDEYERVRSDIDRKLKVVPQYTSQQRRFLSQVTADYYAVRAERMSREGATVTISQAYKQDEFTVVGPGTKEQQVKFADTPAPVVNSPAPTVQAQPTETAPAAEGEAQPAEEAAPQAEEQAQPEELVAPESLKFQQDSQRQSVTKQLFEQESAASKTPLSTAAAKRLEGLQGRQEELSKLETTLKAESERVRGLTREAYLQELENDLDKAKTLLEGMDPKSDDYKNLSAWAKYTNSYLLQEAEKAKAAEAATPEAQPEVAPEVAPEQAADPVIPTVEQIAEEVLQAAEEEIQQVQEQQEEAGTIPFSERFLSTKVTVTSDDPRFAKSKKVSIGLGGFVNEITQANLSEVVKETSVYHETNLSSLREIVSRILSGPRKVSIFVSPDLDLALGQKGQGYIIELDTSKVNGKTAKNLANKVYGETQKAIAEIVVEKTTPKAIKSITAPNIKGRDALARTPQLSKLLDFDKAETTDRGIRIPVKQAQEQQQQEQESAPLKLFVDGVEGAEVPWQSVPNGSNAWQYAIGKIEEDGKTAVWRRKASERGTYGGWRYELEPSKLIVEPKQDTGWQRKPGLDAWDKVPGNGNPSSLGTGYISGKHNENIAARAKERGDIGLLITPLIPSYANKTENYGFIAVDNGVFSQTTPFNPDKFRKLVETIAANPNNKSKTLFVVAPDVVGDAAATLAKFTEWATWIKSQGLPVALAAQDGLENMMDQIPWDLVDVMFIGGSTDWKVGKFDSAQKADAWGKLFVEAQQRGIPIHMGRVNTNERIAGAAQQVGAGTVDGTYLAYGPDQNLPKLEGMLDRLNKMGMDLDAQKFPELGRSPTDQELYEIAFDEDIKTVADLGAFEPALKAINAIRMESGLEVIAGKTAPKEKQKQQQKVKAVSKEMAAFLGDETITELQREARKLAVGKITRDEWDATVARLKPVKEFASVPELTSIDDIKKVGKLKQQKINKPETIKDGQRIALRLDIPSWRDYKTWVVAVHEATKSGSANVRGPIAYTNAVAISNVTFSSREELSFRIAQGIENKDWAAVANGDKQPMTAEEVQAMAKEVLNNPEWVQVGFNPEIHSYFWDRKTGEPIDKAEMVLQVGPLVLAKNPVYGKKSEKLFSFAGAKAKTANIPLLEEAKARIASNEDKESVRKDTGWFQGVDGKWRFEIDDSQSSWNPQFEKILSIIDKESGPFSSPQVMLAGVLDAWPLLSKNQWESSKPYKAGGYILERATDKNLPYKDGEQLTDEQLTKIVKNYGSYVTKKFQAPKAVNLKDILNHDKLFAAYPELAYIQVAYSPDTAKDGTIASMVGTSMIRIGNLRKNTFSSKYGISGDIYDDPFVKFLRKAVLHETQHAIQHLELFAFGSSAKDSSYFKSAGEAEARNVERRIDMTEQERQEKSAESTEDVARNEQIIVINGKPFQAIKAQQPDVLRSRATSETDANYLAAVERGDMKAAQEMVDAAAKAAGFSTTPVFHGTTKKFTSFDPNKNATFNRGLVFFTPDKSFAKKYPTKSDLSLDEADVTVVSAYQKESKVFDPSQANSAMEFMPVLKQAFGIGPSESFTQEQLDDINRGWWMMWEHPSVIKAVLSKYDAIVMTESGSKTIAAKDPSLFKSSDPVTYDDAGNVIPLSQRFQAESPDIRYSREGGVAGTVDLSTLEITLTKDATFSTFLHEMSHIWLAVLFRDAQSANAPKQIVDDANTLLKWFGLNSFAEWEALPREDRADLHERWAYNFEGFISGEEAPSRELSGIFRMFRRWLTSAWTNIRTRLNLAYREELKQLGKPVQDLPILTTEVAEVMGRLLATDEQIAYNQDFQGLMSLHMTKDQWLALGNTEVDWMEILRLQNNMANDLTDELTEQTIRGMEWLSSKNVRMLKEHKAKIDAQRKKLEKQFMPELIKKRVHQARKLIQAGELLNPDGSVKLTMSESRLNLKMVRELFANDPALQARVEAELGTGKTGMLFSKGVDPSQLADVLGYPDAKSMVMEILNAPSLEEDMTTLVDAEMKSKYKDMMDPKKIQKQISAQLAGKMRQKMVAIELRGLDRNLRSESDAGQPQLIAQMEQAQTQLETLLKDEKSIRDERDALKKTEMDIRKEITKEKRKANPDQDKIAALNTSLEATKNANMGRITEINSSLKDLNKQIRKAERLAEGPRTTVATILRAAQEVAIELMGKTLVKDALPSIYETNARMRRRGTTTALARGESLVAIEQKRGELTQAAMAEQATAFQQEMDSFKEFVQGMFRMSRQDMAKGRDYNMAVAARGVAAAFGFGTEKQAETVVEAVKAMRVYAPELAADVEKLLSEANQQATKISQQAQARGAAAGRSKRNRVGPLYRELTVEQMQQLMDRVKGLWKRASEERQVELGGVQRTVDEAADLLRAKVMERMGGKPVGAANSASGIMSYLALATRAEHLMEHLDGQQVGEWQLMVYRWVKDNAVKARGEFAQKLKQLSSILADIDMRHGEKIVATELGGHVFGEDPDNPLISELMHVILHMGNPENLEKMVMGKTRRDNPQAYWGRIDEEGNLDTTDLRKFIERMIQEKVLTEQHFRAAEKIFALMDELTPGALKAYYRVNGYNMKLVKPGQIVNSLGTFRGGYVPAQVDKDATPIGDIMDLKAQMNEQFSNGMPKARDGFTKERVKKGGLPRVLNVNSLPMHIRDVLFYTHLQPVMHDLSKVLTQEDLANALKAYDPAIMRNVLIPWMGRTVRQLTQTPTNNPLDKIVRKIRRNVGLDKLALSFNVMFQQFTGLSVSATRVPKRQLAKALAIWTKNPRAARQFIAGLSPAMAERFDNQMTEIMNKLEEVIQSPNAYKNFRKWAMENGMVLQAGAQNIVDSITWIGAFNEFMETKGRGLSIDEAQKQAASNADSIVRLTQGGGFAEDLSTSEAGTVWAQLFSQFQTVFIVMMNASGWKARTLIQDMGMMRASPRVLALAFFGLYVPLALGNLISEAMRGELGDDEDMDGVSETWFRTLVMAPLAGIASGLPQVGYLINFGLNSLDNKRYNDKMGSTPVFGAFEAARRGMGGVYDIITDPSRELRGQDIKDWATLIATITGIPVSVLAKPASYYLDESRGFYNPDNLGGYIRGMATGTGIPTNR